MEKYKNLERISFNLKNFIIKISNVFQQKIKTVEKNEAVFYLVVLGLI